MARIDVVWTLLNYNLFNAITRVMRAINVCVSDAYSGRGEKTLK